jgi:hypothetical protein
MALAVVEHALGDSPAVDNNVVWFRRHVRDKVSAFLPAPTRNVPNAAPSASAVVRSIRNLESRMDICRSIFQNGEVQHRLPRSDALLQFMSSDAVVGLYPLSGHDRSNPSAAHQVELLAVASKRLDCIYRQFREFSVHALVIASRRAATSPAVTTTRTTTTNRGRVARRTATSTISTPPTRPMKRKRKRGL